MTDVAKRVIARLNKSPAPLCDDCLAGEVGLPRRQQAHAVTGVLEELPHLYQRYRGQCVLCDDGPKMVISRKIGGGF